MSREKAASVIKAQIGDEVVLSGDTVVLLEGELLGKPVDKNDAISMLLSLSGRTHQVITSITVATSGKKGFGLVQEDAASITLDTQVVETNVQFRVLTTDECDSYWRTGEPADKAGGYGIQGLGAIFVKRIEGSYSNVVGLPLAETAQLLSKFGFYCF
jgi:septum formation protein